MWQMDKRSLRMSPWTAASVPRTPADPRVTSRHPLMTAPLAAALLPSSDALAEGGEGTGVSTGETDPISSGSAGTSGGAFTPGTGVPSPYNAEPTETDVDQQRLAELKQDLAALKAQLDAVKRMLADFKRARDSAPPGSQQWVAFNAMCMQYQALVAQLQAKVKSLMEEIAALAG